MRRSRAPNAVLHIFDEYVNHLNFRCYFDDYITSIYYNKWVLCIHDKTDGHLEEITHIVGDVENQNFIIYYKFSDDEYITKDGPIYDLLHETTVECKLRS